MQFDDKAGIIRVRPTTGSPPFALAAVDWKKIGVGAFLAALGGITAWFSSEIVPWLKENGEWGILIATTVPILLNIVRKWAMNTTTTGVVALLLLFCLPLSAMAEAVVIETTGAKAGVYYYAVSVDSAGTATVKQVKSVVSVSGNPTLPPPPPIDPPPGPAPTAFEAEVERLTKTALAAGGTKTTGAAISSVYRLVGDGVNSGSITPANALPAIKAATNTVLASQADAAAWAEWRLSVGDALTVLAQQGALTTKEHYTSALKQVANGLNRATGFQPSMLAAPRVDAGILDGIDLGRIIELIKLIMELLKLFGLGAPDVGGGVQVWPPQQEHRFVAHGREYTVWPGQVPMLAGGAR